MSEDATENPVEFIPVDEELAQKIKKNGPTLEESCYIIRHFFKCVVLAMLFFIILEKISKEYDIFNVRNDYDEPIEEAPSKMEQKENLTFFCDQKAEIGNDSIEALHMLKDDIVNLKQLVIKLGEQLRERRRFECMTKKELSTIEDRVRKILSESDTVDKKIKNALLTYEADKVALFDYAASYAGGRIISIDALPAPTNKVSQILGFFRLVKESSPDQILNPSCLPGECFTFLGDKAKIIIKLGKPIIIGSFSMEHSFLVEDVSSAPRDFQVFALEDQTTNRKQLLGNFTYDFSSKQSLQTYEMPSKTESLKQCEFVMLEILNNHGHKEYTSIYRFRVHAR